MDKINQEAAYLYCIVRDYPGSHLPAVTGMDDHTPVCVEPLESFAAVYNMVALDTFVGASAEENMKNIDWIAPLAMRHEKVIEFMMKETSVYPVRFATLFSSVESLRQNLTLNSGLISDFLDQNGNKVEYSLKGVLDRKEVFDALIKTEFKEQKKHLDALSPGKKYLAEHQFKKKVEAGVKEWGKKNCSAFLEHLTEKYQDFSPRKIFREKTDKNETEMVFNFAFLIHREKEASFLEEIARKKETFSKTGFSLMVSGPWPPYSFCKTAMGGPEF